ncbi:hypothetical protein EG68_01524 [Paragonimus skrjabini miyazakii]|uniref:Major facilitator superfamily (MFS) profile domain-containing protein n=1 Tax=Paragonimus skrjabini miyazakii TaxID=59628 RepID=A0A8S9Z2X7_9TREM|nr:hypothetical protein EG68_01524 [Paragonimus skrjabini miyazakii]
MRMGYTDVDQAGDAEDQKRAAVRKLTGGIDKIRGCFNDRRIILFIVFVALFLDNMLLTIVDFIPIIPDYLIDQRAKNKSVVFQEVLGSINETCWEFFKEISNTESRGLPIYASRGHTPHQHLSVLMEQMFQTEAYANTPKEDELINFVTFLNNRSESVSLHSLAYLNRMKSCREMLAGHIKKIRSKTVGDEHIQIGLMFASKAVVQLMINPMVGPLTNNYGVLFFARALQGVGSACSSVSGMGMLATVYTNDKERSRAFSWALSGLALGVLVGPPFGGICYQFINKEAPFLILAVLALLDGLLQLVALKPAVRPESEKGSSLGKLLRDPYILIAAGSITFGNMGIAMLEPSLPLWMWEKMRAQGWQQGVAFLPCSISYLIGTNIFGPLAHRIGRGMSAGAGMVICGVCLIAIPFSTIMEHLIVPMFGLGFAIGMVDSSMMPIMGHLVDLRHVAVYGSVYAIADVAFCLGFAIGPILSGSMVQTVGFSWMLWSISIVCLLYAPLTLLLRNPPRKEEARALAQPPGLVPACHLALHWDTTPLLVDDRVTVIIRSTVDPAC